MEFQEQLKLIKDLVESAQEADASYMYMQIVESGTSSTLHGNFSDEDALNFINHILHERPLLRKFVHIEGVKK